MSIKVIVSGGGTGGHIFPAVSIANEVKKLRPDAEILFVGAEGRMEMERVPQAGYNIVGLPVRGLIRPLWSLRNIGVVIDFLKSRYKVRSVIRSFSPDVVVGVGGYASSPTLNAAHDMGIPCIIQEQNSYAGVTNKLLAKKAEKICVAYYGMERFFPKDRIVMTGNPVRQALMECKVTKEEARKFFGMEPQRHTILVIGGSLGARTINDAIQQSIADFEKKGVQVLWQTGKYYAEECQIKTEEYYSDKTNLCGSASPLVHPMPFITDMAMAYRAADVVISRAGASSISELCLLGKASILVPSPNVAEDHQTKNARALSDKDAAIFCADAEARNRLTEMAISLVGNTDRIASLEKEIRKMAFVDSAEVIGKIVIETAERNTLRKKE